ncbi:MAG: lysophospholipid acyltransferase family protein [Phycisphaerae bacterium]|nr:lysophospholipid acyltransferase family protein [Phycisphaerae bacterium]
MGLKVPRVLDAPLYVALRAALGLTTFGDLPTTLAAAERLGRAWGGSRVNRGRLRRAMANLAEAFPDWEPERREHHALLSYEHLFKLAVETARAPRLLNEDAWSAQVLPRNIRDSMVHMVSGRPSIMITGHAGNWEVLGYAMALLGFPLHALYRPLDVAALDRWVRETRGRRGLVLVDKFGAAQRLPEILSRGAACAFVADQNAGDRGLFVPFFGRLASTYKTIGLLALRHRAPLICGHAVRLPPERDGTFDSSRALRYALDVVDTVRPEDWEAHEDPLFYITARFRRAIETMVRRAPEQYLWMHRYWKSRPRHERLGRPFPDALRRKLATLPWMTPGDIERLVDRSRADATELAGNAEPRPG